jgi:chaperonin cofactor prefoldin
MSAHIEIQSLQFEVSELTSRKASIDHELREVRKSLRRARLRSWYYRLARFARQGSDKYELWNLGVLCVGTFAAAVFFWIIFLTVGVPGALLLFLLPIMAIASFVSLHSLLKNPATSQLPTLIEMEGDRVHTLRQEWSELDRQSTELARQLRTVRDKVAELQRAIRREREKLLREDWKSMSDETWKSYLERVFAALGGEVEPVAGPENTKSVLRIKFGTLTIAVLAFGGNASINPKHVTGAIAERNRLHCNRVAIVTNGRITRSAGESAANQGCHLIGMKEFPSFVLGSNLELFN